MWLSSDSHEILEVGASLGARPILRPEELASDTATSEAAWLHAVDVVEQTEGPIDQIVAPQVTSPLREPADIERGLSLFESGRYDSLFSCSSADDLCFWKRSVSGELHSVNYDWRNRGRRQDRLPQYIENGSFYIFTPAVIRTYNNRFGERIGMVEMEFWKSFEVDTHESLRFCAVLMHEYLLKR